MTVGELLDRWLEYIEPTRRHSTVHAARNKINRAIRPALGSKRLEKLSAYDLDRFYSAQLAGNLSTTTVRQYHAILSAALHQAERWGSIEASPARKASPPTARKVDPEVPSPKELQALINSRQDDDPILAAAIALAALTGARRGELAALRWSDVDWQAGTVTIARSLAVVDKVRHEGPTKTHQVRKVALDEIGMAALRHRWAWQQQSSTDAACPLVDNPYILSFRADGAEPVSPDTLTNRFRALTSGNWRFHDLRHFSVTTLIAAGVDVRTVAERHGHAQATMTLNRYAHALPQKDREAAGVIGQALAPGT